MFAAVLVIAGSNFLVFGNVTERTPAVILTFIALEAAVAVILAWKALSIDRAMERLLEARGATHWWALPMRTLQIALALLALATLGAGLARAPTNELSSVAALLLLASVMLHFVRATLYVSSRQELDRTTSN